MLVLRLGFEPAEGSALSSAQASMNQAMHMLPASRVQSHGVGCAAVCRPEQKDKTQGCTAGVHRNKKIRQPQALVKGVCSRHTAHPSLHVLLTIAESSWLMMAACSTQVLVR